MNDNTKITAADLKAATAEELSVLTTMKTLREGEFIQDFDDKLQRAINVATDLGARAKLTVTIDIIPAGRTVVLVGDVEPKLPKKAVDGTTFFLGTGNKLQLTDPKQAAFPVEAGFTGRAAAVNG